MAYITRTTGSPMTNQKKFTYSAWLKISDLGTYQRPIQNYYDSNNRGYILFCSSSDSAANTFFVYDKEGGTINYQANTSAKFKDTNGWYHIVWRVDSTQATQSDRVRFYVNGELQSMSISTNCSQNVNMGFNSAGANLRIGGQESGSETWKGLMSHVHFCDGYSYAPTEFGETDSTTGEWKIKTSPSVTYGNNGFFVFKDDAAVTDRSGEGNNFTLSGSITPTQDCPSNVFCTWNRLTKGSYLDMNYGNTNVYGNTATNNGNTWGTISFPPSGKYYWETKVISYHSGASSGYPQIGIIRDNTISQGDMNGGTGGYVSSSKDCYYPAGGTTIYSKNGNVTVSGTSLNDIIMCAMDSTAGNMKFWMGVNGTWFNSGDPANGTNAIWTETGDYQPVPFMSGFNGSRGDSNFGNGYFGTTAVSSAGTNASGIGIFEYDVPTGYTALSTKGLNE